MKRLIVITMLLAFLGFSCRSGKDVNIHVDHSKEKNQFKNFSNIYAKVNKYQAAKENILYEKGASSKIGNTVKKAGKIIRKNDKTSQLKFVIG